MGAAAMRGVRPGKAPRWSRAHNDRLQAVAEIVQILVRGRGYAKGGAKEYLGNMAKN